MINKSFKNKPNELLDNIPTTLVQKDGDKDVNKQQQHQYKKGG